MASQNFLLLKLLVQDFQDNWPGWRHELNKALAKWRNLILSDLGKLLLLVIAVAGGYLVVIFYLRALWAIFSDTQVGVVFATRVSPGLVETLNLIFDLELSHIVIASILHALWVTVVLGIVLKFTGLYRFTYHNFGIGNFLVWGLVCTVVCAVLYPLIEETGFHMENAVLYLMPVLVLMSGGFGLAARLVPEFTVLFDLAGFIRRRMEIVKIRDLPFDLPEI